MKRRQLLETSGVTLVAATAGCIGDDGESGDSVDPNQGDENDENRDDSQSSATTDETASSLNETPEEVVREFYEAMDRGESEAAQDRLHEEHNFSLDLDRLDSADQFDITIQEIETGSLSDAIEEHPWFSDEDEIQEEKESMNDRLDNIGAEDYEVMFVSYTEHSGDGREDVYWVVVPNNGGHLLFWYYHVNV